MVFRLPRRMRNMLACLLAVLLAPGLVAGALFDNFQTLNPGPLSGQGGWTAGSGAFVVRDFTRSGDQLLRLGGADNPVYKSLGAAAIPEGQTGTIFFRFQPTGANVNHGLGITEKAAPSPWTDYRATALVFNDGLHAKMQGRHGGNYADLTLGSGANGLEPLTWYDAWIVVDNAADTADFYLRGGALTERQLVGTGFPFRNGSTTQTLGTFFARVAGGSLDPVLVDDIHAWIGGVDAAPVPPAKSAQQLDVAALFQFAGQQLAAVNARISTTAYPSVTQSGGLWNTTAASSWTSGFYPGMLWQMYQRTGDDAWRTAALARTAGLESQKLNDGTHDLGFMVFIPFGHGYALTGDPAMKAVALTAANTLATRYNPTVGAIQSWGDKTSGNYDVIIDNMMNLELLFWAAKNGGDASLYDLAVQHALTTREQHVRPDGGTWHVVRFDRATGGVIHKRTHQGYNDDSTWTRGQAWGIYGFTMTYRETGDVRFLDTAQLLADYFLDRAGPGGVVYYDFDDPGTATSAPVWDTSASAITAAALLELMDYVAPADRDRYFAAAEKMLITLSEPAFLAHGTSFESILTQGAVSRTGAARVGTGYGDYYFLEALARYEAVPEPSTLALAAMGLLVLLVGARWRFARRSVG